MTFGHLLFYSIIALWLAFEVYLHLLYNRKVTTSNREKTSKYIMLLLFLTGTLGGCYVSPWFPGEFYPAILGSSICIGAVPDRDLPAPFGNGNTAEKILLRHFGESCRGYMKSTKMMIPFVV